MTIALDTNIVVYAFADDSRSKIAKRLLAAGPVLSVQVLNEFAHVARRKWARSWEQIVADLETISNVCKRVDPVFPGQNLEAIAIADRYKIAFFDALLIATAMAGGAEQFYSEDMHHGMLIDDRLTIINPFKESSV